MNILFLCRGNVGRSQMAEAFVKAKKLPDVSVASAGTKLSGPEMTLNELRPGTDYVIESMQEKGIDVGGYRRKEMTEKMVNDADIIVSMSEPENEPTHLKSSTKFIRWKVEDPKGKDLERTKQIRDVIEELVETLLKFSNNHDSTVISKWTLSPSLSPVVLSGGPSTRLAPLVAI